MFPFLKEVIRSPGGGSLKLHSFEEKFNPERGEMGIVDGLMISDTGTAYPICEGIPRMLPDSLETAEGFCFKYAGRISALSSPPRKVFETRSSHSFRSEKGFEFQWMKWGGEKLYGMDEKEWEVHFLGRLMPASFDVASLRGKTVLEIGCGPGLLARVFSPLCREYVGLDLTTGVDIAQQRTRDLPNVTFIQADLMSAPLAKGSFDIVLAVGVLNATVDTAQAFSRIASLVKEGGLLVVWVHPRKGRFFEIANRVFRSFTTRLSPALQYYVSYLMLPLIVLFPPTTLNRLGKNSLKELTQSVFGWLSPYFQHRHSPEEVKAWFTTGGFRDITMTRIPAGAVGTLARHHIHPPAERVQFAIHGPSPHTTVNPPRAIP